MTHRNNAVASCKRVGLAFLAAALMTAGSPLVTSSSASNAGGADKTVSATHGDCKNNNGGLHNGFSCAQVPVVIQPT